MIRAARFEDRTNVAALMVQVWLHTYAKEGLRDAISRYVLTEFTSEKIGVDIIASDKEYFVVENKGHIVGVAVLHIAATCPVTEQRIPSLHKLYIQEHFTGKGIGKVLLAAVVEKCREHQLEKLWLTVSPSNSRAAKFYYGQGFSYIGKTNFVLEEELHENHVLHRATV